MILLAPPFGRAAFAVLLLALFALAPSRGGALPLYASREGATCNTCHVDPNGGGIRNEFGFTFLKNRHGVTPEERWANMNIDPKLNDWITIGLDTRILYYAEHVNGGRTLATSTFFPMQGQVNIAVIPHEHLTLVASHGLVVDEPGFPTGYVARELYGMFEGLPLDAYARAGRFRLPFGLRLDDHTAFTRDTEFLPYDSQKPSAGIELGYVGARWFGQAAFVNDAEPFVGRAQTFAAKIGRASDAFQVGLSGFHRYRHNDRWSLYASTTRGPVTLLGEYAGGTTKGVLPTTRNREAFFAEVDYRALRGLNFRAKLDYADNDRQGPGSLKRRYVGEMDVNPVPFAEAKLSYRYNDDESAGIYKEYLAQLFFPF